MVPVATPTHCCSSQLAHEQRRRRTVATSGRRDTMLRTRFTALVGCSVPIQQAGIGWPLANPQLAAAVANAGGLGLVAVYGLPPPRIAQILDALRAETTGVVGANFSMR